jgi:tetratricopeptide (TPR) repeat protein
LAPTPEDINKQRDAAESFINSLVEDFRHKRWVRILSLAGVLTFVFLNPPALIYLKLRPPGWTAPASYLYFWLFATASFFIAAFIVAFLTRKRQGSETAATTSIIKGLLPYTSAKEDAEWFAKLQRGRILHECMNFCLGADSPFGILLGESGVGKTSFLQAGLLPNLVKLGLRPVYVKFTDSPPLASIRQSLRAGAEEAPPPGEQNLLGLLRAATREDARPVVLILDQFEQFFAHHKTLQSRRPFVQQMAEWSAHSASLPVRILVSIRDDFAGRLIEFQREMDYKLTIHSNFRIEKFEPQEAALVIGVIAREAEIESDEGFIKEFTMHELADREDGTVSPVDIQIFSWMIHGQKSLGERAFNRKALQKLGGVEGLLERFLNRALKARETDARRQAAIKVMLALTDGNVRAGFLSLKDLKDKLGGVIPGRDIEEAVSWLERGDVRLITPVQVQENHAKSATLYELAHERIIPPLRRLAFKEITDVEKAQQTLDRRVNEWIGNNRAKRYLLTFEEWWLIRRYWTLITLGAQKEQKKEFYSHSRRRFIKQWAFTGGVALLFTWGWWQGQQPEYKIGQKTERLIDLLERNNEAAPIQNAALLLALLGDDSKDKDTAKSLWEHVGKLPDRDRARVLLSLAECYTLLGKHKEALAVLNPARSEAHFANYEALILAAIANSHINLGDGNAALEALDRAQTLMSNTSNEDQADAWSSVAESYIKLGKRDEAIDALKKAVDSKLRAPRYEGDEAVWAAIGKSYVKLGENAEASMGLSRVLVHDRQQYGLRVELVYAAMAEGYLELGKNDEALAALNQALTAADASYYAGALMILPLIINTHLKLGQPDEASRSLAELERLDAKYSGGRPVESWQFIVEAHLRLGRPGEALDRLERFRAGMGGLVVERRLLNIIPPMAETYAKLGKTDEALRLLDSAQERAKKSGEQVKNPALLKIAVTYAKLKELDKALTTTQLIGSESYQIMASSRVIAVWTAPEKFNLFESLYWSYAPRVYPSSGRLGVPPRRSAV